MGLKTFSVVNRFPASCFDGYGMSKLLARKSVGNTENFQSHDALRYPSRAAFFH
jgi:hypothetical protein